MVIKIVVSVLFALLVNGCERQTPVPETQQAMTPSATAANSVVDYFAEAEIQAETDEQRAELRRALADMLALTVAELQTRRYADYDGTKGVRSLPELLSAHLVPTRPQVIVPVRFFADMKVPDAQAAIRKKLRELERADSNSPRGP